MSTEGTTAIREAAARLHDDESGATTTEYIIIVSLIAIALIGVITTFGQEIADLFNRGTDELTGVGSVEY